MGFLDDVRNHLGPEQGSDECIQQRSGRFTASRFGDLMANGRGKDTPGETALSYVMEIVTERLTGRPCDDFKGNAATDWGHTHETDARIVASEKLGFDIYESSFIQHGEWIGGSPDGWYPGGIIEIKCPYNSKHHLSRLLSKKVPAQYIDQIQGNIWLAEVDHAYYIDYDPRFSEPNDILIIRVHREQKRIREIEARLDWAIETAQETLLKLC
jgi:hypothetical protein